jgi:bifunctional non-homologous end joining protein LigD
VPLDDYRKKRDPKLTNEPFGPEPPSSSGQTLTGAFVIHQHAATRMHWDLRLEMGGVLLSFAVPRGPSLDPAEKRLAMHTEDHPMDYLDFEAVIPAGQYGGGPMIVWDRGRVRYLEGPAEEEVLRGKLDFELEGHKAKGRFALVKIKNAGPSEWLLFKKQDAFARSGGPDLVVEKPRSILSGLTVDELGQIPAIAKAIGEKAKALGARVGEVDGRTISPMVCAASGAPDHGADWLYELKLDGVRAIATKKGDQVWLSSRKRTPTTESYPEVTRAVRALAADVVLDGEIVAFDREGQPNFQRLGSRIHLSKPRDIRRAMIETPVSFVVFDLLAIGDRDLRPLPTVERKRLLSELLRAPGILRPLDHLEGDGRPLLAFCKARHLEGVVAKKKDAPYKAGPKASSGWVKMKCERDEEFVVVGFTQGEVDPIGALDLATFDGDRLIYRGKVGSGIGPEVVKELLPKLEPLRVKTPSAEGDYAQAPRGRTHVKAELVARVRFMGFTDGGQVLRPVFGGLRDDVEPRACTVGPAPSFDAESEAPPEALPKENAPIEKAAAARLDLPAVTNKNKVLWPGEGITKGELVAYYVAIAPAMLRYLSDRPTMLVRYPDGIAGKMFYQWNVPAGVPSWVRTCRILGEDGDQVEVFLIDDAKSLAYVANMAAIPIHILAARIPALEKCDFLTIDFDVGLLSLKAGVLLANELRDVLKNIGLVGFPKTSGQSGLHVFVPLGGASYDTARFFADVLGRILVQRHPDVATMERVKAKRGKKVYVDTGQTGPTRTIVCPYAVRASAFATVSTPLDWDEVTADLDPKAFSIKTVPARFEKIGDPMAGLLEAKVDIAGAVKRLEALVRKG